MDGILTGACMFPLFGFSSPPTIPPLCISALILPTVNYPQMPNQLVRANKSQNIHVLRNKYDPKLPSALAETSWFKSRDQISRLPCSRYVVDVIIFTYTKTSNTTCPISLRMYRQSSAWLFSNPSFAMAASSFTFHCRPACLSP